MSEGDDFINITLDTPTRLFEFTSQPQNVSTSIKQFKYTNPSEWNLFGIWADGDGKIGLKFVHGKSGEYLIPRCFRSWKSKRGLGVFPVVELVQSRKLWVKIHEIKQIFDEPPPSKEGETQRQPKHLEYVILFRFYLTPYVFSNDIRSTQLRQMGAWKYVLFPDGPPQKPPKKKSGDGDDDGEEDGERELENSYYRTEPTLHVINPKQQTTSRKIVMSNGYPEGSTVELNVLQLEGLAQMIKMEVVGAKIKIQMNSTLHDVTYTEIGKDAKTTTRMTLYWSKMDGYFYNSQQPFEPFTLRGGFCRFDVGTGKTLLITALIQETLHRNVPNRPKDFIGDSFIENSSQQPYGYRYVPATLVIVPKVVLAQTKKEIEDFSTLRVCEFTSELTKLRGGKSKKTSVVEHVVEKLFRCHDVILVSQSKLLKYVDEFFSYYQFRRIVLDECHNMKNVDSFLARSIFKLNANYKWLVSATPIPNRLSELHSYMKFLGIPFLNERSYWASNVGEIKAELREQLESQIWKQFLTSPPQTPTHSNIITTTLDKADKDEYDKNFKELVTKTLSGGDGKTNDEKATYEKKVNKKIVQNKISAASMSKLMFYSLDATCASIYYGGDDVEEQLIKSLSDRISNNLLSGKLKTLLDEIRKIDDNEEMRKDNIIITVKYKKLLWIVYQTVKLWVETTKFKKNSYKLHSFNDLTKGIDKVSPLKAIDRVTMNSGFRSVFRKERETKVGTESERNIIFASSSIIKEGLNMEYANHMIIVTPEFNRDEHKQLAGRITRGETQPKETYVYRLSVKDTVESRLIDLQYEKMDEKNKVKFTQ